MSFKLHFGNWSRITSRVRITPPLSRETIAQFRARAAFSHQQAQPWISRVPVKARVILGLFLAAGVMVAVHTAISPKDASLHLKLQHGFHEAQVSLRVDGDLAFSGRVTGAARKKFGIIPTDPMQGSLSQIIAVRSGQHKICVKIEPGDGAAQEDSIKGDFSSNAERDLPVSAHHSALSLSWQGTSGTPVETSSSSTWLSRHAGSFFLTMVGSVMSAIAGYVLKELPCRLRPASDSAPNSVVSKNGRWL